MCLWVVEQWYFQQLVTLCIVINTVLLSAEYDTMSEVRGLNSRAEKFLCETTRTHITTTERVSCSCHLIHAATISKRERKVGLWRQSRIVAMAIAMSTGLAMQELL